MKIYTAVCERVGGWWEITVPELDGRVTQARRLDQVEETVRSLVTLIAEVPPDSVAVAIQPVLPTKIVDDVREAAELRAKADRAAEAASRAVREAARELAHLGLTVRDIGATLRVTPQRVSQLLTRPGDEAKAGTRGVGRRRASGGATSTRRARRSSTARADH
jgi:hypothetical protein